MPRGRKPKVQVEPVVEVVVGPTEKEQFLERQSELLSHLTWLETNKLQDIGQVAVALERVNHRLTEL